MFSKFKTSKIVTDVGFLRQKSSNIDSVEEAQSILKKLDKVLSKTKNGVGVAAIQIGIPKKISIIKHSNKELCLINPEIINKEDQIIYLNEGCLSLPKVFKNTKRFRHFTIDNNIIIDGKFEKEQEYFYYSSDNKEIGNDGLISIAVQHEIDHFNGVLITDHNIEINKPIARKTEKISRNNPCPCGSGKKFKKCCLGKGIYD